MIKNKTYKTGNTSKYVEAICQNYDLDFGQVKAFLFSNFPELRDKAHCSNCQAGMKMFWHNVTPGIVGILIKAIEFVKSSGKNSFHYKDLDLNYSEASNLQKLRLHALIAHDSSKQAHWLITKRGGAFLRNEEAIPASVKTFRNKIEEHSEKMVRITDFRDKFPLFQSEFAYEFKPQVEITGISQVKLF